jgi:hypothetical protein
MFAGGQGDGSLGLTNLRRRADSHRIDVRTIPQQSIKFRCMRDTRERSMGINDRDQFHFLRRSDGRHMLVARDLAEAYNGDAKRTHHHSLDPVVIKFAAP